MAETKLEEARAHVAMVDAAKEAVDFLSSYFGPISSDDPEGWSDDDARDVCGKLQAALKLRAALTQPETPDRG